VELKSCLRLARKPEIPMILNPKKIAMDFWKDRKVLIRKSLLKRPRRV
jgi:hypothetical protein